MQDPKDLNESVQNLKNAMKDENYNWRWNVVLENQNPFKNDFNRKVPSVCK